MKNPLTSLHEALVYQLEGLYDAEKELEKAMPICSQKVSSPALKAAISNYSDQASDKRTKLKRAFSYLSRGPFGRKNGAMRSLLKETLELCDCTPANDIRDVMVMACMKNINHYKIGDYSTALSFAIELQLDTVSDLLHDVIHWERQTSEKLAKITTDQINARAIEASAEKAINP